MIIRHTILAHKRANTGVKASQYWRESKPILAVIPHDLTGAKCVQRREIDIDEVKRFLELRVPKTVIAERLGISRRTLGRFIKSHKDELYSGDDAKEKGRHEPNISLAKDNAPAEILSSAPSLPPQTETIRSDSDTNKNHQVLQDALRAFDEY